MLILCPGQDNWNNVQSSRWGALASAEVWGRPGTRSCTTNRDLPLLFHNNNNNNKSNGKSWNQDSRPRTNVFPLKLTREEEKTHSRSSAYLPPPCNPAEQPQEMPAAARFNGAAWTRMKICKHYWMEMWNRTMQLQVPTRYVGAFRNTGGVPSTWEVDFVVLEGYMQWDMYWWDR